MAAGQSVLSMHFFHNLLLSNDLSVTKFGHVCCVLCHICCIVVTKTVGEKNCDRCRFNIFMV